MSAESIYVLMPKVMASIGVIGKTRTNQQQNFQFRGIDDVMNALHEPLTSHGVFFVPEVLEADGKTEQAKKSQANIATEQLKETYDYALADERIAKAALHAWQSVLSSLQSLASAHREEARLGRVG